MVIKIILLNFAILSAVHAQTAPSISGKKIQPPTSRSRWMGTVGYYWWQETFDIKNPRGEAFTLQTNSNGPCFGVGIVNSYPSYDIDYHLCGFFGVSDIASAKAVPTYSQRNVPTYGALLGTGLYLKPKKGGVRFGFQPAAMFRYANWTEPAGWVIESKTRISGGGFLEADWGIKRVLVSQKTGYFYPLGWVWGVNLTIVF